MIATSHPMRHLVGGLYTITALTGLYWSIYLTMTGLYGVPFSRWYLVLFLGGVVLLIGAILSWTTTTVWARWLPIAGSLLLSAYFVPAFITVLRQGEVDFVRILVAGLVVTSFIVAVATRRVTGASAHLPGP